MCSELLLQLHSPGQLLFSYSCMFTQKRLEEILFSFLPFMIMLTFNPTVLADISKGVKLRHVTEQNLGSLEAWGEGFFSRSVHTLSDFSLQACTQSIPCISRIVASPSCTHHWNYRDSKTITEAEGDDVSHIIILTFLFTAPPHVGNPPFSNSSKIKLLYSCCLCSKRTETSRR